MQQNVGPSQPSRGFEKGGNAKLNAGEDLILRGGGKYSPVDILRGKLFFCAFDLKKTTSLKNVARAKTQKKKNNNKLFPKRNLSPFFSQNM